MSPEDQEPTDKKFVSALPSKDELLEGLEVQKQVVKDSPDGLPLAIPDVRNDKARDEIIEGYQRFFKLGQQIQEALVEARDDANDHAVRGLHQQQEAVYQELQQLRRQYGEDAYDAAEVIARQLINRPIEND